MKQKHKKKNMARRKVAGQHIDNLMHQAESFREYSDKYVNTARKIAMKMKMKLKKEHKLRICRKCKSFLIPGYNCRVRLRRTITYYCTNCRSFSRYGKEVKK